MIRRLVYILLSIILHIALIWLCLATSINSIPISASHHHISPHTTITLISANMATTSEINKSTHEDLPIILPDSPTNPTLAVNQKQEKINNKKKIKAVKKTNNKISSTNQSETTKRINKNKHNNPPINTAVNIEGHNNITKQGAARYNGTSQINIGEQQQGEHYYSLLKQEIERHKIYPRKARKQRHRGRVILQFNIRSNGSLYNAKIIRSSGFNTLDNAALTAIIKSRSIGPKPVHISSTMSTEIEFKLDRN